jgi:hypothetical protein
MTFWITRSCSSVEVYRPFGGMYCLHYQGFSCRFLPPVLLLVLILGPVYGDNAFIKNIGGPLTNYKVLHIRRSPSSWKAVRTSYLTKIYLQDILILNLIQLNCFIFMNTFQKLNSSMCYHIQNLTTESLL